jgi:hypothetical protein
MDVHDVLGIISALGSLGAVITSLINRNKITQVHMQINSRLTELLTASTAASHAQGVEQGRAEGKK